MIIYYMVNKVSMRHIYKYKVQLSMFSYRLKFS